MQIQGPSRLQGPAGVHGAQRVQGTQGAESAQAPQQASQVTAPTDELSISSAGQAAAELHVGAAEAGQVGTDGVRLDKVAELRSQIEAGTFETTTRIDGAVERLLDELA